MEFQVDTGNPSKHLQQMKWDYCTAFFNLLKQFYIIIFTY